MFKDRKALNQHTNIFSQLKQVYNLKHFNSPSSITHHLLPVPFAPQEKAGGSEEPRSNATLEGKKVEV